MAIASFFSVFSVFKLRKALAIVLVFTFVLPEKSFGQVWEAVCNASMPVIQGGRLLAAYGTARFSGPTFLKNVGNAGVALGDVKSPENIRLLILALGECGVFAETLWFMSGGVPSIGEASLAALMLHALGQNFERFQGKFHFVEENAHGIGQGANSVSAGLPHPMGQMLRTVSPVNKYFLTPLHLDPGKFHTLLHIPDFFDFVQSVVTFEPKTQSEVGFAHNKVIISTILLCAMVKSPDFSQNPLFGIIEAGVGIHALSEYVFPLLLFLDKGENDEMLENPLSYGALLVPAAVGLISAHMGSKFFFHFSPPTWMPIAMAGLAMGHVFLAQEKIRLASHLVTQIFMVKCFSFPAFRDKPLELHLLLEMHGVAGALVTAGVDALYHYFSASQSLSSALSDNEL